MSSKKKTPKNKDGDDSEEEESLVELAQKHFGADVKSRWKRKMNNNATA